MRIVPVVCGKVGGYQVREKVGNAKTARYYPVCRP